MVNMGANYAKGYFKLEIASIFAALIRILVIGEASGASNFMALLDDFFKIAKLLLKIVHMCDLFY